jgi:hypothetical protein
MNTTASGPAERLVEDYLARVDAALRDLPPARRQELLEQVREHLDDALPPPTRGDEAQVRTALDRLGSPADIAAEARRSFPDETRTPAHVERNVSSTLHDVGALALLVAGGFLFLVGWAFGVALLWTSRTWNVRDKVIGTLLLPGGLLFPLLLGTVASGPSEGPCVTSAAVASAPAPSRAAQSDRSDAPVPPAEPSQADVGGDDAACGGDSSAPVWGIVLLIGAFLIPIASAGYLGWRRSQALTAGSN